MRVARTLTTTALAALLATALVACADDAPAQEEPDAPTQGNGDEGDDGPAGDADGSLESPAAVGDTIELEYWDVALVSVTPDATEEILAENSTNEAPEDGTQLALFEVEATFTGPETGDAYVELTFGLLEQGGEHYLARAVSDACGVYPDPLMFVDELATGETGTGNVCLALPAEALDGGVFSIEYAFDGQPRFVSID